MSTRRMMAAKVLSGPILCDLKREPENTHDENAIMVIVAEPPYTNLQSAISAQRRGSSRA
jgi:hypothetical protein